MMHIPLAYTGYSNPVHVGEVLPRSWPRPLT